MSALTLHAVHKTRGSGRHRVNVIREVSFAVAPGEVVLLRGPSGSGKTTLLALAAGLLTADRGRIVLDGSELGVLTRSALRKLRSRRIGFVFQRASLLSRLSARENIEMMGRLAGLPAADSSRASAGLLEQLSLTHVAGNLPRELSVGEEMRVAVARALIHRPAIVLADEPTANLDGALGSEVARCLADAALSRGAAVLVATHDPRLESLASRTLQLVDGALVGEGAPL